MLLILYDVIAEKSISFCRFAAAFFSFFHDNYANIQAKALQICAVLYMTTPYFYVFLS